MKVVTADFPGYDLYADGRVFSRISQKFLKQQPAPNGYLHVVLTNSGFKKRLSVHRLLATAFLGQPAPGMVVNHKNGLRHDNRVENLEWVSQSENVRLAYVSGQRVINNAHKKRCAEMGRSRALATPEQREYVLKNYTGKRGDITKISNKINLSRYVVSYIIKGFKK